MENQIVCPHCGRTITNEPLIESAVKANGTGKESFLCECGEKITYWQITAQLRDQKKTGARFRKWFHGLSKS